MLTSVYDISHSKERPLPQTWASVDIKLGSLTVHLDDDKWHKGEADSIQVDVLGAMKTLGNKNTEDYIRNITQEGEKINLGQTLLESQLMIYG